MVVVTEVVSTETEGYFKTTTPPLAARSPIEGTTVSVVPPSESTDQTNCETQLKELFGLLRALQEQMADFRIQLNSLSRSVRSPGRGRGRHRPKCFVCGSQWHTQYVCHRNPASTFFRGVPGQNERIAQLSSQNPRAVSPLPTLNSSGIAGSRFPTLIAVPKTKSGAEPLTQAENSETLHHLRDNPTFLPDFFKQWVASPLNSDEREPTSTPADETIAVSQTSHNPNEGTEVSQTYR
jgi:hypothetical protein